MIACSRLASNFLSAVVVDPGLRSLDTRRPVSAPAYARRKQHAGAFIFRLKMFADNWESYVCRFFGANCTTIAWSGKGLIHNSGCSAGPLMPTLYKQAYATRAEVPWDFSRQSRPDAVLIYLGTNGMRRSCREIVYVSARISSSRRCAGRLLVQRDDGRCLHRRARVVHA